MFAALKRSKKAAEPPKRLPLDEFLAGLPAELSEQVGEAAAIMMRNEQSSKRLRGVEAELRPFFITAVASFLVGLVLLVFFSEPGGFLDRVAGAWPLLTAALGFLPALLTYYAIRIRNRSRADIHNFELNKEHFLPHGAIYFPSDSARADQMVTLVEVRPEFDLRKKRYDNLKPGMIW